MAGANLRAASTLTRGTRTFRATLAAIGSQNLIATDTVIPAITATSGTISVT
ncbi:MAG: hypothetical protein ACRD6W_18180 [Nitrososphaerales archaeon]